MLGCDVPLLGEPTAELNKVPGNLCLRLAPWGERPASWHFPAEHITSLPLAAAKAAWQGAQRPVVCRAKLPQTTRQLTYGSHTLLPALTTGMLANLTVLT